MKKKRNASSEHMVWQMQRPKVGCASTTRVFSTGGMHMISSWSVANTIPCGRTLYAVRSDTPFWSYSSCVTDWFLRQKKVNSPGLTAMRHDSSTRQQERQHAQGMRRV